MDLVSRYDVAALGTPERTSQGFLRIPAYLTRVGVFEYRRADGQVVRELRPRDEVFAERSLATLAAAPVTDLHPTVMISPANVRELSVGHVSDHVKADGNLVAAHVTVQEANAIAAVERGDRRELSCGYACRTDATPGVYEGSPYDQVQRDITYNHVALLPRGAGRAGPEVSLRLDADGDDADGNAVFRLDAGDAVSVSIAPEDGEIEDDAPDADDSGPDDDASDDDKSAAELEAAYEALLARSDELRGKVDGALLEADPAKYLSGESARAELVAERDALQARCDAQRYELAEAHRAIEAVRAELAQVRLDQRCDFDAQVNARSELVAAAKRVLPADHKYDGLSTRAIHEAVLTHLHPSIDLKERTDEYLGACFEEAMRGAPLHSVSNLDDARRITAPSSRFATRAERADARETFVPDWQKPLSYSKTRR